MPEKLPEKLPDLQIAIALKMAEDSKITYNQLAKSTHKSREAIRKNIGKLKGMGIVKRIGSNKGGYSKVNLPNSEK